MTGSHQNPQPPEPDGFGDPDEFEAELAAATPFPTRLVPPSQMPTIRTQHDLERTWSLLMGELGFAAPQVWLMLLVGGRPAHLVKLEDLPVRPREDDLEMLPGVVADVVALLPEAEPAFLFARPGGRMRTPGDLAWARALADLGRWPVHLANDAELRVATLDDLGATG